MYKYEQPEGKIVDMLVKSTGIEEAPIVYRSKDQPGVRQVLCL